MDNNYDIGSIQKTTTARAQKKINLALFSIWGMGCPTCEERIRTSLLSLNGVEKAYVDRTVGIASVAFNPEFVKVEALINAVANAGNDGQHEYGAQLIRKEFTL